MDQGAKLIVFATCAVLLFFAMLIGSSMMSSYMLNEQRLRCYQQFRDKPTIEIRLICHDK